MPSDKNLIDEIFFIMGIPGKTVFILKQYSDCCNTENPTEFHIKLKFCLQQHPVIMRGTKIYDAIHNARYIHI